jgi:hypothetical protein
MRERTARLVKPLLTALVRVLLLRRGRQRAAVVPQPPVPPRPLAPPPRHPVRPCPCERERILQRRRIHWAAAYGTPTALHPGNEAEFSV